MSKCPCTDQSVCNAICPVAPYGWEITVSGVSDGLCSCGGVDGDVCVFLYGLVSPESGGRGGGGGTCCHWTASDITKFQAACGTDDDGNPVVAHFGSIMVFSICQGSSPGTFRYKFGMSSAILFGFNIEWQSGDLSDCESGASLQPMDQNSGICDTCDGSSVSVRPLTTDGPCAGDCTTAEFCGCDTCCCCYGSLPGAANVDFSFAPYVLCGGALMALAIDSPQYQKDLRELKDNIKKTQQPLKNTRLRYDPFLKRDFIFKNGRKVIVPNNKELLAMLRKEVLKKIVIERAK